MIIKHYLKIAWRNIFRNKIYSAINITGISVGMTAALLNGLWIGDELSFNKYHRNYDRIAQVNYYSVDGGKPYVQTRQSYLLADALKTSYGESQFKQILMATGTNEYILSSGEIDISRKGQFIEAGGPELFTLRMLYGEWSGLGDPHSIFLAESTATALFGNVNPIGESLIINTDIVVKVTGVYEDLPRNTRFHEVKFFAPFDLYLSINPRVKEQGWKNHSVYIYTQIQPGRTFDQVSSAIKDVLFNNISAQKGLDQKEVQHSRLFLFPMKDWHLHGNFDEGFPDKGSVYFVRIIGIIGAFVLLLACINFINLNTACSEKRAKEVGIRKAIGSFREQLIRQFMGESFLIIILAFMLSLLLATIALPWFNDLAAKEIVMPWPNFYFWVICLIFIIVTSLLAGGYPALHLSSFLPVRALTGTFRMGRRVVLPRKMLVIMQFSVSVILITSTIVVFRQIEYAKSRPVGYSQDRLLMIEKKTSDYIGKFELLRNELKSTGVVDEVAESNSSVTNTEMSNGGFEWKGKDPSMDRNFATLSVTPEYGETIGWQFIEGRDFSRELTSDSASLVVNEAAVKYMGLENPVGEIIRWAPKWRKPETFKIIGVIKDMVVESPFEETQPTVFFLYDYHKWINIRLKPNVNTPQALRSVEAVFEKLIPNTPFEYKFADQDYHMKFAAQERTGKLAAVFASLAIFISCLGLLGLSAFVAEQRTKEVGVRKISGGSVRSAIWLLTVDFFQLVVAAIIMATPVSYYVMHKWLENFAYKTELSWWIFVLAGLLALGIALLTVSWQSWKAATRNPVEALRYE
jgi:putative ABC transport system permease protein